jgi:DNA-binding CsgD family transcriptional regulator
MALSNLQYETLLNIIDNCNEASSKKDIEDIWLQIRKLCGISGLVMAVMEGPKTAQLIPHTSFVYGIFSAWMDDYRKKKMILNDPLVKVAKRKENNNKIINWRETFSGTAITIADIAGKEYGHLDGYAVFSRSHNYTHASSITSITFEPERVTESQLKIVYRLIPHIHRILERPGFLRSPNITKREKQVLKVAAKQKSFTYDSVGEKMGITGRTAKHHFTNLRKKLEVDDNYIVIEKARLMGLVK